MVTVLLFTESSFSYNVLAWWGPLPVCTSWIFVSVPDRLPCANLHGRYLHRQHYGGAWRVRLWLGDICSGC